MSSRKLAIIAILIVSAVVFNGCQKKQPPAEPQPESEPQAQEETTESTSLPESNPEAEQAALKAADAWLALIDSGNYAESWQESAEYVKGLVGKDDWQRTLQGAREPLGRLVSRRLKSTRYTTTAPGAPDGQYVIIQYNSSFENKKSAVETVTPMMDSDGQWRVSGYYIK